MTREEIHTEACRLYDLAKEAGDVPSMLDALTLVWHTAPLAPLSDMPNPGQIADWVREVQKQVEEKDEPWKKKPEDEGHA